MIKLAYERPRLRIDPYITVTPIFGMFMIFNRIFNVFEMVEGIQKKKLAPFASFNLIP